METIILVQTTVGLMRKLPIVVRSIYAQQLWAPVMRMAGRASYAHGFGLHTLMRTYAFLFVDFPYSAVSKFP